MLVIHEQNTVHMGKYVANMAIGRRLLTVNPANFSVTLLKLVGVVASLSSDLL